MKNIFTFVVATIFSSVLIAQVEVSLNFNHMLGDEAFALEYPTTVDGDYQLNISRLEYYISEITITHDGGQITEIEDVYLLVQPADQSIYPLGNYPIYSVENVSFGFGVDSSVNNEDPASYPSDHPLAYQSPSMHWGWSTGYRFICVEGYAGFNFLNNYQIHALGNDNYDYFSLNYNATEAISGYLNIGVDADYVPLFNDINVQYGAIVHSDNEEEAVQILSNARTSVFDSEGGIALSVEEVESTPSFSIYPNPIQNGTILIELSDWNAGEFKASILDISGKLIEERTLGSSNIKLDVNDLSAGVYLLKLEDKSGRVFMEKFQK